MADTEKGALEKLVIKAFKKPDYSGSPVDEFEAYFNPDEYNLSYDLEFDDKSGDGATGSPMVFKRIKPQEYSLKFMLDGTGVSGEKIDIPKKLKKFFDVVGYDGEIHRPRYLQVLWGTLKSDCIILKADIAYKVFKPDGTPLRAIINASFRENIDDSIRVRKENKSSPDLTHVRVVKEGDTLPIMAYEIYDSISYYLKVAQANDIHDFRNLVPGTKIFFPPVEKVSNE